MPLSGSCFWGVILPVEKTNLLLNPSHERGTTGAAAIQSATLGSAANEQQFGAWSLSVAPNSNGTSGAALGTWTAGNGTDYTVSAYVNAQNGVAMMIGVGDSAGVNLLGSTAFTGGGTWQRYSYSFSEAAGAVRRVVVRKTSGNNTGTFYVDGVQAEVGSLTTYLDGDQDGCYWLGAVQASQSTRSGTYRGGGSVVALADLGFAPDMHMGIGMPPLDVNSIPFSQTDGAEFLYTRAEARTFTLTAKPIVGTTLRDYHITRRTIINALKIDLVDPQQPTRFWYTGAEGTVQIDAVLASGLELGQMNGPMAEDVAVKFIAHSPYWTATTQEGTALASTQALGSTMWVMLRDSLGRWGTLGNAGTTTDSIINALAYQDGTLFVGGVFTKAGGTASGALAMWSRSANSWGTFGGTVDAVGGVNTIAIGPDGTIYFGGNYGHISGLNARYFARYSDAFGTVVGGTPNSQVKSLAWSGGTLFMGGFFTSVPGTSRFYAAGFWTRAGYGSLTGGTVDATYVSGVTVGLDKKLYVTGITDFTKAGGTTANRIAQWNGGWGSMGTGLTGAGAGGISLATGPSGAIYVVGAFGSAGGGSVQNTAQWNGAQWLPMGYGLGSASENVLTVFADQKTGDVYGAGFSHAISGPRTLPDSMARWNGYTWLPLDVNCQTNFAYAVLKSNDGTLFVAGSIGGTAQAAAVAQVINTGIAAVYPVFKARNTSASGTARVYQLVNTLTGNGLYFDLVLQPGEEITLTTNPGNSSFTSNFSGNLFRTIIPGSNISSFRLLPGTNYISFFADSSSLAPSIYWTPTHWSADGGTVY